MKNIIYLIMMSFGLSAYAVIPGGLIKSDDFNTIQSDISELKSDLGYIRYYGLGFRPSASTRPIYFSKYTIDNTNENLNIEGTIVTNSDFSCDNNITTGLACTIIKPGIYNINGTVAMEASDFIAISMNTNYDTSASSVDPFYRLAIGKSEYGYSPESISFTGPLKTGDTIHLHTDSGRQLVSDRQIFSIKRTK